MYDPYAGEAPVRGDIGEVPVRGGPGPSTL